VQERLIEVDALAWCRASTIPKKPVAAIPREMIREMTMTPIVVGRRI
jgi:hypothetical protein